jgi:threonyl-tRNA synthetase
VRFDLSYIGADNQPHRPVMIHRAPFGSMERFCGVLIEHFAGDFPAWLAPEQVRLLPISDKVIDYAKALLDQFSGRGPARHARRAQRQARRQDPPRRTREGAVHARASARRRPRPTASPSAPAPAATKAYPVADLLTRFKQEVATRALPEKTKV